MRVGVTDQPAERRTSPKRAPAAMVSGMVYLVSGARGTSR